MKQIKSLLILIIGIGLILTIFGCSSSIILRDEPPVYAPVPPEPGPPPWAPAHGHRAKYRYYYYPETYVYFDINRRLYFYFHTNRWIASVSLPTGIYIDVNNYIVLDMDVDEPYRYHSEVVKRYPPGHSKRYNDKKKGKHWEK